MRTPPPPPDLVQELDVLLRTRYGLILVQTEERDRVEALLRHVADHHDLPLFAWSPSKGLARRPSGDAVYDAGDPSKALRHIEAAGIHALYHLPSLSSYLERDDPTLLHRLADAAATLEDGPGAIVVTAIPSNSPPRCAKALRCFGSRGPTPETTARSSRACCAT